jgi:dihydrofolate reductase
MEMNLIDEYRINVNPVVLGHGVPLFKNIPHPLALNLLKTKRFSSGVVGFYYEIIS